MKDSLSAIPGVVEVHDLHIWSISSKSVSLTVHIKVTITLYYSSISDSLFLIYDRLTSLRPS